MAHSRKTERWILIPKTFKKIKGRKIYCEEKTGKCIDLE